MESAEWRKKDGMMKLKREKERGKREAKRRKLIYLSGLDFSMVFVVMGLGNWGLWELFLLLSSLVEPSCTLPLSSGLKMRGYNISSVLSYKLSLLTSKTMFPSRAVLADHYCLLLDGIA
ncbi:hypothetical protein ABZX51_007830 [Aspergillus tubingensis]